MVLGRLLSLGTNSSPRKIHGWKTILSFWGPAYSHGRSVSFREGLFRVKFWVLDFLPTFIMKYPLRVTGCDLLWSWLPFTPWKMMKHWYFTMAIHWTSSCDRVTTWTLTTSFPWNFAESQKERDPLPTSKHHFSWGVLLNFWGSTLPETNSSPLKIGRAPKRKRSSSNHPFLGAFAVSFREGTYLHLP